MVPVVATAQSGAKATTAGAKGLTCAFSLMAIGTWNDDTPSAEVKPAKLAVEFRGIDTQDGTAEAAGFGPPNIIVRLTGGNLHFLQVGMDGAVYVTTVFDHLTPAGKLKAVHTRHEYTRVSLPGFTSRPEQYYGECEVIAAR